MILHLFYNYINTANSDNSGMGGSESSSSGGGGGVSGGVVAAVVVVLLLVVAVLAVAAGLIGFALYRRKNLAQQVQLTAQATSWIGICDQ